MAPYEDFKDEKGNIDWNAHRKAEIALGERCYKCGGFIIHYPFFGQTRTPGPDTCRNCDALQSPEELRHPNKVRCPFCGTDHDASDMELYRDGEHEVNCSDCGRDFTTSTHIEFTFISPPLAKETE